jgi:hypothetical protein
VSAGMRTPPNALRGTPLRVLGAALGCALLAGALYYGCRAALSDVLSVRARAELAQIKLSGKIPPPLQWRAYRDALQAAIAAAPDNAQLYEDVGYLYAMRGMAAAHFPEIATPLMREALGNYQLATRYRPLDSHAWSSVALAHHYLNDDQALLWDAFDKAMAYGANEPDTQAALFVIGMPRWSALSAPRQAALRAAYARARPHLKDRLTVLVDQYHRRQSM